MNLTSDPESSGDYYWPQYTIPELEYKELALDLPTGRAVRASECAFWNQYLPDLLEVIRKSAFCNILSITNYSLLNTAKITKIILVKYQHIFKDLILFYYYFVFILQRASPPMNKNGAKISRPGKQTWRTGGMYSTSTNKQSIAMNSGDRTSVYRI